MGQFQGDTLTQPSPARAGEGDVGHFYFEKINKAGLGSVSYWTNDPGGSLFTKTWRIVLSCEHWGFVLLISC